MRSQVVAGSIIGLTAILSLAACTKKSGKAVVLDKEHIAAREPTPTPTAQQSASPGEQTPVPKELASEEEPKPLAEDEIVVDTYIMKKDARGTSRDPRAMDDEQWIVNVQMVNDLRRIKVQTDKAHWNKVKVGDRINVSYRQGNYTGTVWSAEIE